MVVEFFGTMPLNLGTSMEKEASFIYTAQTSILIRVIPPAPKKEIKIGSEKEKKGTSRKQPVNDL